MSSTFRLLLNNYGKWGAIFLLVFPVIFVWYAAHSNSKDCEKVAILWGMVSYTKGGQCDPSKVSRPESPEGKKWTISSPGNDAVSNTSIGRGLDKSKSPKEVEFLTCMGKIKSKNGGVSNVAIHVSARRESETFKYNLDDSSYVELLDIAYSEGRWFKVIVDSESNNKVGWLHEDNVVELINCDDMVN